MNFKPKAQKSKLVVLAWVKGKDMKEFHFHSHIWEQKYQQNKIFPSFIFFDILSEQSTIIYWIAFIASKKGKGTSQNYETVSS